MRNSAVACAVGLVLALPGMVAAGDVVAHEQPAAPGMRAYADPATGTLLPAPPAGAQSLLVPHAAVSTSADGLLEQTAPGGGVMVDVQGRFNNQFTARVQPDGSIAADCHLEP